MSKATTELRQVLTNFFRNLRDRDILYESESLGVGRGRGRYDTDTLGVMRWQPRRRGGRVMVFWAHLGEGEGDPAMELESLPAVLGGVNTAFRRSGSGRECQGCLELLTNDTDPT